MQSCSADELGISRPSVSRIIHKTINGHFRTHIVQQFIKFPLDNRQLGVMVQDKTPASQFGHFSVILLFLCFRHSILKHHFIKKKHLRRKAEVEFLLSYQGNEQTNNSKHPIMKVMYVFVIVAVISGHNMIQPLQSDSS